MRKTLLGLLIFPAVVIQNTGFAKVETTVVSEVSGENASVRTEVTNIVNQKETKVESTRPGTIRVQVNNGEVKVESSGEASPTVTVSNLTEEANVVGKAEGKNILREIKTIKASIFSFFGKIFSPLQNFWSLWKSGS